MLENLIFVKFVIKKLHKKENIVLITDNDINTKGDSFSNINNTDRALEILRKVAVIINKEAENERD